MEVVDHLQKLAGKWVRYGYRRLTKQMQREGRHLNSKRVMRLMRQLKLNQPPYKRKAAPLTASILTRVMPTWYKIW